MKNIDELAENYAKSIYDELSINNINRDNIKECAKIDFKAGYNQCVNDALPKWVSVKERLPEIYETVLVVCKKNVDWRGNYWNGKRWELTPLMPTYFKVTHWMPLPTPPNNDEVKGGIEG